ncbi:MAG: abortive infection family protein [Kiritimatiellales bacterium]|nr:abortive infection family protein [Kiritimatiellales bacterium]
MSSAKVLPPLTDSILFATARLVDDAQTETREPSHADIEFCFKKAGVEAGDPKASGQMVGKEKRVRATLSWALENNEEGGQSLVSLLIDFLRSRGGFRLDSPNFVGVYPIQNLQAAFAEEGFSLTEDGELRPNNLESLSGTELTSALEAYVRRAQKGNEDAALLTGTSKDLLEATAAHVIQEKWGSYSDRSNFPTLLGQAFVGLGLKTTEDKPVQGEPPQCRIHRGLFEAACAVNTLRNKQGTGHGRPWLSTVTPEEARLAIQTMGLVAELMLTALKRG